MAKAVARQIRIWGIGSAAAADEDEGEVGAAASRGS